jgi:STE24 endopeptidase
VVILSLVAAPLQAATSRRYEAEADWAALNATGDPQAMETLHRRFTDEGLADPDPPGWFAFLFDSHPSGLDRVAMARAWRER